MNKAGLTRGQRTTRRPFAAPISFMGCPWIGQRPSTSRNSLISRACFDCVIGHLARSMPDIVSGNRHHLRWRPRRGGLAAWSLRLCQQLARLGPRHGLPVPTSATELCRSLLRASLAHALKDFYDITPACRAGDDAQTSSGNVEPELPALQLVMISVWAYRAAPALVPAPSL
jgi:hypothetical protein